MTDQKRGLQPEYIAGIASWMAKKEQLDNALKDHLKSCLHWGFASVYDVEANSGPQFPRETRKQCAYCGTVVKG